MSKRKKSTRRNSGGRRTTVVPPYGLGVPSMHELDRDMAVAQMAMDVASSVRKTNWWVGGA